MRFAFDDPSFDFEALRAAGYADFAGAQLGEVLAVASRIPEGDTGAWCREWTALADRVHELACSALDKGRRVDARESLLRAHNYYRTAEFYLRDDPGHDDEAARLYRLSQETFARAARLLDHPAEPVRIPYEDGELPGYLFLADDSGTPRPTLLHHGGFDSTLEEGYFFAAAAAVRRGYNCLCYEGPGQGSVLRDQRLPFRPDWERVTTPVVDFALGLPEVDPSRLFLVGTSLGGYLAVRAAAFEHRLAGCVAHDGVWRLADAFPLPPFLRQWVAEGRDDLVDPVMRTVFAGSTLTRWVLGHGLWAFGTSSPAEFVRQTAAYDLTEVVDDVRCPVLVLAAENDLFFTGQPERVHEALRSPKAFHRFTDHEGAGAHCHEGALGLFHLRLFDWLEETAALARPVAA